MSPVYRSIVNRISKHRLKRNGTNQHDESRELTQSKGELISPSPYSNNSVNASDQLSEADQLQMLSPLVLLYEPGDDQIYLKTALEATRKAKRYMDQTLTSRKENEPSLQNALVAGAFIAGALAGGREMIGGELRNFSPLGVKKYISQEKDRILKESTLQPQFAKNVATAAESLAGIVVKLEGVISNLIPQSPEYRIPFGFAIIIFKARKSYQSFKLNANLLMQGIIAKRRKQEDALKLLDSLDQKLPTVTLMHFMYPIVKMKILIAEIYINILQLLQQIANYLSSNPIIKLLDATFALERYDFDIYLSPIDRAKAKIEELFRMSHVADGKRIKITTDRTATVVKSIYDGLGGMSKIVSNLEIAQIRRDKFTAETLVSDLIGVWEPFISEPADELELWRELKFHISPKDHWAVNGILPKILEWQNAHSHSILWISSPHLGRDSWLTEFSLDLIHAAQTEEHSVTFAMCDRPQGKYWTFLSLIKQLICQTIYRHPKIVLEVPALFNTRTFNKALTIGKLLQIFHTIVEQFESLLVIIDRVDLCNRQERPEDGRKMLLQLSALTQAYPGKLKIMITSAEDIQSDVFTDLSVSIVKVDLKKKKQQKKKTDFLQGRQQNVRTDLTRPTYTRFARRYLSVATLRQYYVDFEFDQDPEYLLVKRWVPEYEQDILWDHTKKLRDNRAKSRPTWTRMARRHLSITTLRRYRLEYQIDQFDPDFVIIKNRVPEAEQERLWAHTKKIREARVDRPQLFSEGMYDD